MSAPTSGRAVVQEITTAVASAQLANRSPTANRVAEIGFVISLTTDKLQAISDADNSG
jgi:hypothetical protein